jgi:hypothetical protein
MEGLTGYQIYFLARDGEILRTLEFNCAGDQDAVQKAIHLRGADEVEIEVWERTRFVDWLPVPALQCHDGRPSTRFGAVPASPRQPCSPSHSAKSN